VTRELLALAEGALVGVCLQAKTGQLSFRYAPEWQADPNGFSLSLSMPRTVQAHGQRVLATFLWGLLPESPAVLEHWAKYFHVSAANPFALLSELGEDCAGGVQFVTPEHYGQFNTDDGSRIEWLSEQQVATRLRQLDNDASAFRLPPDRGRISLAGVQAKTALTFDGQRWGVPQGRAATSHILKPAVPGFPGILENEHFCQRLAQAVGFAAANTQVLKIEEQRTLSVERFDRVQVTGGQYRRIHQEDFCQALGFLPLHKYQDEGGPAPAALVALLRSTSAEPADVWALIEALAFNWLIGGADAHAKNYSLLIGGGDHVRLAPLYDLISLLPYRDRREIRLSMKIGDEYRLANIGQQQWLRLAKECRLDHNELLRRIAALADRLLHCIPIERDRVCTESVAAETTDALCMILTDHVRQCADLLPSAP